MSEVDDNLNYMLGQLSLVVSEFNQVTTLTLTILMTTLTLTTLTLTTLALSIIMNTMTLTLTLFYGPHSGEDRAGGGDGGHRRGSAGGVQEGRGRQEIKQMGISATSEGHWSYHYLLSITYL